MYKVEFLASTKDDMLKIANYISNDLYNPTAAIKLIAKLEDAKNSLKQFPLTHPKHESDTIEPAIITDNREYIRTEGYQKLEKGNYYIVFLSDENASGVLSIISANNGKFDIIDLENNYHSDIVTEAILEFDLEETIDELEND